MKLQSVLENQKRWFNQGKTLDYNYRIKKLIELKIQIEKNEKEILEALKQDLGKSHYEGYITEVDIVLDEIDYFIKNIKKLSKPEKVRTSFAHFPSKSKIVREPYGTVLVISPWNYPFQLSLVPMVGAFASGNCVLIKTSSQSKYTGEIIRKIITSIFKEEEVAYLHEIENINEEILKYKYDYIFFTGGKDAGRKVMMSAADNLTPVTLELGGKSPCIVAESADIKLAAKRIMWGKIINSGQTCVAPDYVLIDKKITDKFIKYAKEAIKEFLGENPLDNKNYPHIINEKHYNRLLDYLEGIVWEGESDDKLRKISPMLVINPDKNSKLMKEEIFGPILPIIEYENINEAIKYIKENEKPLALYLFTTKKEEKDIVIKNISFGGGCINDTIVHLANNNMPFGGVGASGIGNYHGKYSYRTFTHEKSILEKSNLIDLPMRYHPYSDDLKLIKRILKLSKIYK